MNQGRCVWQPQAREPSSKKEWNSSKPSLIAGEKSKGSTLPSTKVGEQQEATTPKTPKLKRRGATGDGKGVSYYGEKNSYYETERPRFFETLANFSRDDPKKFSRYGNSTLVLRRGRPVLRRTSARTTKPRSLLFFVIPSCFTKSPSCSCKHPY